LAVTASSLRPTAKHHQHGRKWKRQGASAEVDGLNATSRDLRGCSAATRTIPQPSPKNVSQIFTPVSLPTVPTPPPSPPSRAPSSNFPPRIEETRPQKGQTPGRGVQTHDMLREREACTQTTLRRYARFCECVRVCHAPKSARMYVRVCVCVCVCVRGCASAMRLQGERHAHDSNERKEGGG